MPKTRHEWGKGGERRCFRLSVYTKAGDGGKTSLQSKRVIPKHNPAIKVLGALDELSAHIGNVKSICNDAEIAENMERVQKNLMAMMSLISQPKPQKQGHFDEETTALEMAIDAIESMLPPQKGFVMYGKNPLSAAMDMARAVARRAETCLSESVYSAENVKIAFAYINRLSDYLYMMARRADFIHDVAKTVRNEIAPSQNVQNKNEFNLEHVKVLFDEIQSEAERMGLSAVMACCDAHGNPVAVHVMDGAYIVSFDVAVKKAYTSVALKMPTSDLKKLVQPGQGLNGLDVSLSDKIITIAGGIPLFSDDGRILGGLGVSGGTAEQDEKLAQYGSERSKSFGTG